MTKLAAAIVAFWVTGAGVVAFQIEAPTTIVLVGQQVPFAVSGAKGAVRWATTAQAIASVSSTGVVKGIAPGQATITARSGNLSAAQGVVIRNSNDPDNTVPPAGCSRSAASASQSAVQAAIDAAASDEIVCIPAGTSTWTTAVTLTTSLTLVGHGAGTRAQCDTGGQTSYTCIKGNIKLLTWTTLSTGYPQLAQMTFYGDTCSDCGGGAYTGAYVNIAGLNGNMRLHDLGIDAGASITGLIVRADVRGVGWNIHCMQQSSQSGHCALVLHDQWLNTGTEGDNSWAQDSTIGTAEAWYWEDSTFGTADATHVGYCTDDFQGGRVVYRFNDMPNCSMQNHGTETGGRPRGYREVDYYRNTVSNTIETLPGVLGFRGGSGYCWQNTFTTSGSGSFTKTCEGTTDRRDDTSHDPFISWYVWSKCGTFTLTSLTHTTTTALATLTSHQVSGDWDAGQGGSYFIISGATPAAYNGTFFGRRVTDDTFKYTMLSDPGSNATGTITKKSPFDGNSDTTGHLCLDGFGSGKTQYISGQAPPFGNVTPLNGAGPEAQPVYGWSNRLNGSQTNVTASMDFVQANRDLYNENASYNGTSQRGVYVGTSLPASCTTGDAAWITNQGSWNTETTGIHAGHGSNHTEGEDGKRYACTSTNTWTASYGVSASGEPYAYPHPLRSL